jgi:hypothetical protein
MREKATGILFAAWIAVAKWLAFRPGSGSAMHADVVTALACAQTAAAKRALDRAGITVTRFLTGSYVTSLDMAGVSITVSLLDSQATKLWDAPVHTAALRWGV